jgi:hypothetical protein
VMAFPGYTGISLYQLWPPGCFAIQTDLMLPSMSDEDVLRLHEEFARGSKPMPVGGPPPDPAAS